MTLLKVPEVAARLGCSPDLVYETVERGDLRHYRIGKGQGGIRVSEAQLADFLAARERGGQPKPVAPRRTVKLRHLET